MSFAQRKHLFPPDVGQVGAKWKERLTCEEEAANVLAVVAEGHALLSQANGVLAGGDAVKDLEVRLCDTAVGEVEVDRIWRGQEGQLQPEGEGARGRGLADSDVLGTSVGRNKGSKTGRGHLVGGGYNREKEGWNKEGTDEHDKEWEQEVKGKGANGWFDQVRARHGLLGGKRLRTRSPGTAGPPKPFAHRETRQETGQDQEGLLSHPSPLAAFLYVLGHPNPRPSPPDPSSLGCCCSSPQSHSYDDETAGEVKKQ